MEAGNIPGGHVEDARPVEPHLTNTPAPLRDHAAVPARNAPEAGCPPAARRVFPLGSPNIQNIGQGGRGSPHWVLRFRRHFTILMHA